MSALAARSDVELEQAAKQALVELVARLAPLAVAIPMADSRAIYMVGPDRQLALAGCAYDIGKRALQDLDIAELGQVIEYARLTAKDEQVEIADLNADGSTDPAAALSALDSIEALVANEFESPLQRRSAIAP